MKFMWCLSGLPSGNVHLSSGQIVVNGLIQQEQKTQILDLPLQNDQDQDAFFEAKQTKSHQNGSSVSLNLRGAVLAPCDVFTLVGGFNQRPSPKLWTWKANMGIKRCEGRKEIRLQSPAMCFAKTMICLKHQLFVFFSERMVVRRSKRPQEVAKTRRPSLEQVSTCLRSGAPHNLSCHCFHGEKTPQLYTTLVS